MNRIRQLKPWFAFLLAMAVTAPAPAADPPAAPKPPAKDDAKGAKEAKAPAKPRVRVTISKETTYITEPLRPDGYVDYIAAVNRRQSRGVTPENNAAVLFWKAMGPAEISENLRERYFKMLGIPPLPPKGDYYVNLYKYAELDKPMVDPDEMDKLWDDQAEAMRRPWKKEEFPVLAGWIEANRKPLALVVEGTKRPRCYEPGIGEEPAMIISILLPGVQQYREMARVLAARAMLRLGAGEVDAAWDDLLACHRLVRLASQGPTLVGALVAIVINNIACAGDQALMQYPGLTAPQAKKIYNDLSSLPPMQKMSDKIDVCERYMFLDCVQVVARQGLSSLGDLPGGEGDQESVFEKALSTLVTYSIDWDIVLRMGNSWYDRLVEASRKPTRKEQTAAMTKIDEGIKKLAKKAKDPKTLAMAMLGNPRKAVSERIGEVFIALLVPAIQAATDAEARGAMQQEVTRLGFALVAYRADHGTCPGKLAELSPKYGSSQKKCHIDIDLNS